MTKNSRNHKLVIKIKIIETISNNDINPKTSNEAQMKSITKHLSKFVISPLFLYIVFFMLISLSLIDFLTQMNIYKSL